MPATERGPDPRPRPSSTVSAWSSRVWPSATRASPAAAASACKRTVRAAASGPPSVPTSTVRTVTGARPSLRSSSAVASARSAEPACRPWSTVTAPAGTPARGASKATAAARARESAPPLQATSTGCAERVRPGRTAPRNCATAGLGPLTGSGGDGGPAEDPVDPLLRRGELVDQRQVGRALPDTVEALHADEIDDAADEGPPVGVLLHLLLQAQQPAQHAVERAPALAPLREPLAQGLHRRDDVRPDAVHHVLGVPLDEAHHGGDPVEDLPLVRVADQREQALALAVGPADGVAETLEQVGEPLAEHLRREVGGLDELGDLVLEVALEPRERGELQLVGDLVQAHPEAEVARVDAKLALGVDDVRRDQQQPAAGAED